MIVIVGHGPSLARARFDVDQHTVVRLKDAKLFIGKRTDIICSSQARYERKGIEFWHLAGDLLALCVDTLKPFNPKYWKPTSGLSAAIIARHKYPEAEIGVLAFDYTMHPERTIPENKAQKLWRHDAFAEHECIKTLGVIEV